MNWITELGHTILNKMGLESDQPTKTQRAVLDAVKRTKIEPIQVVDQSETDAAARIYNRLESVSALGTSDEWKRNEMRDRLLGQFPKMKEAKLKEIVEGLYVP